LTPETQQRPRFEHFLPEEARLVWLVELTLRG